MEARCREILELDYQQAMETRQSWDCNYGPVMMKVLTSRVHVYTEVGCQLFNRTKLHLKRDTQYYIGRGGLPCKSDGGANVIMSLASTRVNMIMIML